MWVDQRGSGLLRFRETLDSAAGSVEDGASRLTTQGSGARKEADPCPAYHRPLQLAPESPNRPKGDHEKRISHPVPLDPTTGTAAVDTFRAAIPQSLRTSRWLVDAGSYRDFRIYIGSCCLTHFRPAHTTLESVSYTHLTLPTRRTV